MLHKDTKGRFFANLGATNHSWHLVILSVSEESREVFHSKILCPSAGFFTSLPLAPTGGELRFRMTRHATNMPFDVSTH